MRSYSPVLLLAIIAAVGCRSRSGTDAAAPGAVSGEAAIAPAVTTSAAIGTPSSPERPTAATTGSTPATVGAPAPDFTLPDLDGKPVSLSAFKGKTVVLEWFNPECPFVRASHTKGSLVSAAEKHQTAGVVWLAINSNAAGKQGSGREKNLSARDQFKMKHPILLDESGDVGKLYGAKTTPHMYVIAPDGKLVYRGAIDNSPDGEGESPKDGKLVNYVDQALGAVKKGVPLAVTDTEPYGCSVKYKS